MRCSNGFEAKRAAAVNKVNVLVFAEWLTPGQHGVEILETWRNAKFGEGFGPQWQEFLNNCCLEIQQMEAE